MIENDKILSIINLFLSYDNKDYVLNNFSLSFERNTFNVIMGENGSGKSSLLNFIAGLKKEEKGVIIFNNKDITNTITQQRDLAYLFQTPVLYPHLTVYQNIYMVLSYYGLSEEEKDEKIKTILKKIKMIKYVNFKPRHLSTGQVQKVALAKAMVREPSLLLLDEPFSSLDKNSQVELISILKDLMETYKTTIIMNSHDFSTISNVAHRLIFLKKGEIYFDGTPLEAVSSKDEYLKNFL